MDVQLKYLLALPDRGVVFCRRDGDVPGGMTVGAWSARLMLHSRQRLPV